MAETEPAAPDQLYPMGPTPFDPNIPTKNSFGARWPDSGETFSSFDTKAAGKDLADLQRRQMGERDKTEATATGFMNEDRQRMVKAFNAEGIGPDELQPFDQQKQREKYSHSPVETFGSLGAVFALVASSFTRQPMTNGLNAAAAAMNAIKAGDDKEYDKAFEAWKSNTDLAVKRHAIQHQVYSDSLSLAETDMRSAEAKLRMQAARFGDEKVLLLLDKYGVSKELMDLVSSREKLASESAKASEQITKVRFQSAVMQNDEDLRSGDPVRMEHAFDKYYGKELTPEQQALRNLWHEKWASEGRAPTTEEQSKVHQDFQRLTSTSTTPAGQAARMANTASNDPNSPFYGDYDGAYLDALKRVTAAKTPERPESTSTPAQAARLAKKWSEDPEHPLYGKPDEALLEANKQLAQSKTVITGNRRQQLESHIGQYDVAVKLIDKVDKVLDKYVGSAGLAGKARRLGERLGNIMPGSSGQTDRVQMMRDISELQLLAPRLLLDQSTGRPLSVEASHINDVIAGLSAGDTVANTKRAMKEVKQQLKDLQQHNKETLGQIPKDNKEPAGADTGADTGGDWWTAAPLKE